MGYTVGGQQAPVRPDIGKRQGAAAVVFRAVGLILGKLGNSNDRVLYRVLLKSLPGLTLQGLWELTGFRMDFRTKYHS